MQVKCDSPLDVLSHVSHEWLSHATVRQLGRKFTASFTLNELRGLLFSGWRCFFKRVALSRGVASVAGACRMRSGRQRTAPPEPTRDS